MFPGVSGNDAEYRGIARPSNAGYPRAVPGRTTTCACSRARSELGLIDLALALGFGMGMVRWHLVCPHRLMPARSLPAVSSRTRSPGRT